MKFSKLKCPRCQDLLNIVLDECVTSKHLIVGYCYNTKHRKLKVRIVAKMRMQKEEKIEEPYSMADLGCIFCGKKDMWFKKKMSHVAGNKLVKECMNCKIGIEYLGKIVKDCLPYEEIIRIRIVPYGYNE